MRLSVPKTRNLRTSGREDFRFLAFVGPSGAPCGGASKNKESDDIRP